MATVVVLQNGRVAWYYEAESVTIHYSGEIILTNYTIPPDSEVIPLDIITVPTEGYEIKVT